jgi:predicted dehydrogenase
VLVVGAGSSGRRHAKLLARAGAETFVTDPVPERAAAIPDTTPVRFDLDRLDPFDGIVIASPSSFHLEQTRVALATGAKVLVEKPLAVATEGLDELLTTGRNRLMVGFNLRLHLPVERFVSMVHGGITGPTRRLRVWFGSYLPEWRPGTDYRASYSAIDALGGGILLDGIHELDLVIWLLDDHLDVVGSAIDRVGTLDIDVEDSVVAILRHANGAVVEVSLDMLSRRYRRGIEVVGDDGTLRLDWARGVIEGEDAGSIRTWPATTPIDLSYWRQAQRFLLWLRDGCEPPVDAHVGAASVRLAARIRAAAR